MLSVYLEYLIQLVKPLPPINSSHVAGPCNQIVNLKIGPKKRPLISFIKPLPGGNKAVFLGFIIFALGIFMLYSGPNTGIYFQLALGVLVGTALGATAIGVPVSEVGKHFPNETRTIATGIVTAAASIGYFLSPLLTKYSLVEFEWEQTLKYFMIFIVIGLVVSVFLFPAKTVIWCALLLVYCVL